MFKMYGLVLCVAFLVNQINMLPVGVTEDTSEITEILLHSVEKATMNPKMDLGENMSKNVKMLLDPTENPPTIVKAILEEDASKKTEVPLLRAKRSMIHDRKCPKGHARLWRKGPCVTCEVYLDHLDADKCPGDSSS